MPFFSTYHYFPTPSDKKELMQLLLYAADLHNSMIKVYFCIIMINDSHSLCYLIYIFTHLKLWIAVASENYSYLFNLKQKNTNLDAEAHILFRVTVT